MITIIYLAVLLGSVVALAVTVLRPRRKAPTPPAPVPPASAVTYLRSTSEEDVRTILAAAVRLAEQLAPAA